VVLKQLDGDLALGEELDVVVKLVSGMVQAPGFFTLATALVRMA